MSGVYVLGTVSCIVVQQCADVQFVVYLEFNVYSYLYDTTHKLTVNPEVTVTVSYSTQ